MIRYALICEKGHDFESWFQDSAAYDQQAKRKLIGCPVCGSSKVDKAIMAPRLSSSAKKREAPAEAAVFRAQAIADWERILLARARELARCFHCGRCTECDNCYIYCPDVAIAKHDRGFAIDLRYCKGCGVCPAECPRAAMEMVEEPTEF